MSSASQVNAWFGQLVASAKHGLEEGGISYSDLGKVEDAFLASSEAGRGMYAAATRYALDIGRNEGGVIDLGHGVVFIVREFLSLSVDYSRKPEAVAGNYHGRGKVQYVGTPPEPAVVEERLAIGRLNIRWRESDVMDLLAEPGCCFTGSGAWVRSAFLAQHQYDHKYYNLSCLVFPDTRTSRWQEVRQKWEQGPGPYLMPMTGRAPAHNPPGILDDFTYVDRRFDEPQPLCLVFKRGVDFKKLSTPEPKGYTDYEAARNWYQLGPAWFDRQIEEGKLRAFSYGGKVMFKDADLEALRSESKKD